VRDATGRPDILMRIVDDAAAPPSGMDWSDAAADAGLVEPATDAEEKPVNGVDGASE